MTGGVGQVDRAGLEDGEAPVTVVAVVETVINLLLTQWSLMGKPVFTD